MKYGLSLSRTSSYSLFINPVHMLRDFMAIHSQPQRKGTHFYSLLFANCVVMTSQIYELAILRPQNWFPLLPDNHIHKASLNQHAQQLYPRVLNFGLIPRLMSTVSGVILGKSLSCSQAAEKAIASGFMQGRTSALGKLLSSNTSLRPWQLGNQLSASITAELLLFKHDY